ncbi:MAG: MBL fold metallo-hydrolase [Hyphomonadaceae bacterium]
MPSSLRAAVFPVTPFQQNTALIWCDAEKKAAFVDPGGEVPRLKAALAEAQRKEGVTLEKILLTHGHLDHAGAAAELAADFGVPVEGPHRDEKWLLDSLGEDSAKYGLEGRPVTPDRWLSDGDQVTLGAVIFDVVHCPGHTPGHVVFVDKVGRFAFVGDVLFQGSIGRTDFPRGNHAQLVSAIRDKLFPLGDDIRFLPGHGPISGFGRERRFNPFVSDDAVS